MRILEGFAVLVLALLLAGATLFGLLLQALFYLVFVSVLLKVTSRVVDLVRGWLHVEFLKHPLSPESRPYLRQALFRCLLWVVVGVCVQVGLIPIQFSHDDWAVVQMLLWGGIGSLCLLEGVPRYRLAFMPNLFYGCLLAFLVVQLVAVFWPVTPARAIILEPPFQGSWHVFQGGRSPLLNHHYFAGSQRYALDLLLAEDALVLEQPEEDPERYATFGQAVLAPIDGTVVNLHNGAVDQRVGSTDPDQVAGNFVTLETQDGRFVLLAHLKQGSLAVATGDTVRAGSILGLCGNSGNTSQPHLHIQAMTGKDFFSAESKPVPMLFARGGETPRFYRRNQVLQGRDDTTTEATSRAGGE